MARTRQFIEANVLDEAKRRIHHIYDTHDYVLVGFSGGKDSLAVLHLTREVAAERGIDTVPVQFYDEELIPDVVIDFVNGYRLQPWVDMTWLTVPLQSHKFILGTAIDYVQWDPNRPHLRPMPEWGLPETHFGYPAGTVLSQYDLGAITAHGKRGKVATLTGIRAAESLMRLRASLNKLNENYINDSGHPRVSLCKPIFDWQENDVFRYFYDRGIRYCPIYDQQVFAGQALRVATPLHAEAAKRIGALRASNPDFYDRLMDLFPEMLVQERYWDEFDQTAIFEEHGADFDSIEAWIRANVPSGHQRTLALKRLKAVRVRAVSRPHAYPPRHVLKQFVTGAYKREIMPMRDADGKDMIARDLLHQ